MRVFNLDDARERREFLDAYGTLQGRALAHRLGLRGNGSARFATDASCYAWNAETAAQCRRKGDVAVALIYERIADRIYATSNLKEWW